MDAQAQDDPFLADAIEGYRSLPEGDHAADVTKLKARLRQKAERDRTAGFYLLRIAAVSAVLVVAWIVLQQFQSNDKSAEVADIMQPTTESTITTDAAQSMDSVEGGIAQAAPKMVEPSDLPSARLDVSRNAKGKSLSQNQATADQVMNFSTETSTLEAASPPPVVMSESKPAPKKADEDAIVIETEQSAAKENMDKAKAKPSSPEASTKSDASARAYKPAVPGSQASRTITGKVTDENGDPLIGATVQVANSSIGTSTEVDGSYTLTLPAGMESLVFTYAGNVQIQVTLGISDKLNVQLANNDMALSEVVVMGYSQADDNEEVITPRPKGGYKQFREYVADNMRHPEGDKHPRPKEVVRIRFKIGPDGSLSDFSSKSNASQAYQDEAIRLLKEGPRWESTTGTTASYRFVFE